MEKRIQSYFKTYPNADVIYVAGDGQAFLTESKAVNHDKTLKKDQQKVTPYTRKEYETAIAGKPKKETAAKTKPAAKAKTDKADKTGGSDSAEGNENDKKE